MGQNPIYRNIRLQVKVAEMDAALTATLDGTTARTGSVKNTGNAGTVGAATVVATEYGDGQNHVTKLVLTDFIVGAPVASTNLAIGNKIYSFPAGKHLHSTSWFTLGLTQGGVTSDTPDVGIGSVIGTGAVVTLDGTATFEDYITGQTWAVALDGTAQDCAILGATAGIFTGISINDDGDVKDVFLNGADGWHASVTGNLTATGTIWIAWVFSS